MNKYSICSDTVMRPPYSTIRMSRVRDGSKLSSVECIERIIGGHDDFFHVRRDDEK